LKKFCDDAGVFSFLLGKTQKLSNQEIKFGKIYDFNKNTLKAFIRNFCYQNPTAIYAALPVNSSSAAPKKYLQ
jgi:hypothetical protein